MTHPTATEIQSAVDIINVNPEIADAVPAVTDAVLNIVADSITYVNARTTYRGRNDGSVSIEISGPNGRRQAIVYIEPARIRVPVESRRTYGDYIINYLGDRVRKTYIGTSGGLGINLVK